MSNDVAKIAKNEGGCFAPKAARAGMAAVLALGLMPTSAFAITSSTGTVFDIAGTNVEYDGANQVFNVEITTLNNATSVGFDRTVYLVDSEGNVVDEEVLLKSNSAGTKWESDGAGKMTAEVSLDTDAASVEEYKVVINQNKGIEEASEADEILSLEITKSDDIADVVLETSATTATVGKVEEPVVTKATLNGEVVDLAGCEWRWYSDASLTQQVADITEAGVGTYYGVMYALSGNASNFADGYTKPVTFEIKPVASSAVAFEEGTVTAAVDQSGKAVTLPAEGNYEFSYVEGKQQYLTPTELTLADGTKVDLTAKEADGETPMYVVTSNQTSDAPGTYTVTITPSDESPYYGAANVTFEFGVAYASLKDAFIYEGDDMANTSFTYQGGKQNEFDFNFAIGETELDSSDIAVTYYNADGTALGVDEQDANGEPINAGSYLVRIAGTDSSVYKGSVVTKKFTIAKADLSSLNLSVDDKAFVSQNAAVVPVINWLVDDKTINVQPQLDYAISSGQLMIYDKGAYTLTLTPAAAAVAEGADNFTGTAKVSFNIVGTLMDTDILYQGQNYTNGTKIDEFDTSKKEAFDLDDITVTGLEEDEFTVEVTKDGKVVTDFTAPGEYMVKVNVNTGTTFDKGGSRSWTFNVYDGAIADTKVYVAYDGVVVDNIVANYDGKNVMDKVKVTVKAGTKVLKEGTDYEIVIKEGTKEVDSIVDAGNYTVVVEGLNYSGSTSIDVVVNPIEIAKYRVMPTGITEGDAVVYPYTGSAVVPTVQYSTGKVVNGEEVWTNLDADLYEMTIVSALDGETVTEAIEKGTYVASIALKSDVKNYTMASSVVADGEFNINDIVGPFYDVASDAWYAVPVFKANANKYMTGYTVQGETRKAFNPSGEISRGEVACVMANMASVGEGMNNSLPAWAPLFSDVASSDYFAQTVTWAAGAGIMNGYGDGIFGPADKITREQFACTLYNYAKAMGDDVAVKDADATLAKFGDADSVSDWAKTAVAWAVENGIMGNGGYLDAKGNITRAETAAMAVNYQPEPMVMG